MIQTKVNHFYLMRTKFKFNWFAFVDTKVNTLDHAADKAGGFFIIIVKKHGIINMMEVITSIASDNLDISSVTFCTAEKEFVIIWVQGTYNVFCTVRTFWETHKIWKNHPRGFDKWADLLSKHATYSIQEMPHRYVKLNLGTLFQTANCKNI